VTVKLVDNSVKRKVGKVMVVKVIIQNKIPGNTLIRNIITRARLQAQELWVSNCATAVSLAWTTADGIAEAIVLVKLWMAGETVPERESIVCWIFPASAELTAIMTGQFSKSSGCISRAEVVSSRSWISLSKLLIMSKGALSHSATVARN
jgi:hypothetical protein